MVIKRSFVNKFQATGLFQYALKTSKNLCFSNFFNRYRKRPVALKSLHNLSEFKSLHYLKIPQLNFLVTNATLFYDNSGKIISEIVIRKRNKQTLIFWCQKHSCLLEDLAFRMWPQVFLKNISKNFSKLSKWLLFLNICDALRDLVPFVQFKKRKKHLWRNVTFRKVCRV